MEIIEFLLTILFVVLAVHVITFAVKNIKIPVVKDISDFVIRYKKTFLYTALIFFLAVGIIVLKSIIFFKLSLFDIILIAVLICGGLPFLLMSILFKIRVTKEHLIFKKHFIKYDEIKGVVVNKYNVLIYTNKKIYKCFINLDYKEELLLVMSNYGVEVTRNDL